MAERRPDSRPTPCAQLSYLVSNKRLFPDYRVRLRDIVERLERQDVAGLVETKVVTEVRGLRVFHEWVEPELLSLCESLLRIPRAFVAERVRIAAVVQRAIDSWRVRVCRESMLPVALDELARRGVHLDRRPIAVLDRSWLVVENRSNEWP